MLPLTDVFSMLPSIPLPEAGLLDQIGKLFISFDFLDLVLWYPQLTQNEFLTTLGVLVAWKLFADQIDRLIAARVKATAGAALAAFAVHVATCKYTALPGWVCRWASSLLGYLARRLGHG